MKQLELGHVSSHAAMLSLPQTSSLAHRRSGATEHGAFHGFPETTVNFPTCPMTCPLFCYSLSHMGVSENSVPLNPMVLLIIIPVKWLFHWEYTLFSDKPISSLRFHGFLLRHVLDKPTVELQWSRYVLAAVQLSASSSARPRPWCPWCPWFMVKWNIGQYIYIYMGSAIDPCWLMIAWGIILDYSLGIMNTYDSQSKNGESR